MSEVGIRALKQNASGVVQRARDGEVVTVTDRGRPVARLTPIGRTRLDELVEAGLARRARRRIADLPAPEPGPSVAEELRTMRDDERY